MARLTLMVKVRSALYMQKIIAVSSSIANWRQKILERYHAKEYNYWQDRFGQVTFFGLYRPKDFLLFLLHGGERIVHWCGSDVLQAGWHYRWLQRVKAKHICENEVEQGILQLMLQQEIEVRPTFLSNPNDFQVSFKPTQNPEVYLHVNKNSERESGYLRIRRLVPRVPEVTFHIFGRVAPEKGDCPNNVSFHGYVPEEEFNAKIKNYQCGLRLHVFDGMSEIISKSVLLGQYPISYIRYPHVDTYNTEEELVKLLRELKNKKEPNYQARDFYLKEFTRYDS